jgi:hypothetical protein
MDSNYRSRGKRNGRQEALASATPITGFGRLLREHGKSEAVWLHSSTPSGSPRNSARRESRDHLLEGLKKAGFR